MPSAVSTMPDFTGSIIDERYQLLSVLGSGTYGVVYKAVDTHPLADPAALYRAIKIVSKIGRHKSQLAAVRREIALQSAVSNHRNVVGLQDAFEDDHYFYIVLDFCAGGDLFEHICEKRTYVYQDELLRKAFVSLVDAVQACHDAKIYHRDLKPENVLTNEDGSEVYLADFGLATNQTVINEFGCGTTIYMSPECVGREFGYKPFCAKYSDVWALGVILINMISGRHPWGKATMEDECFANFVTDPYFLLDMLPVSDGANDILRRILAPNPRERIGLAELRAAVLALDTFFISEDELAAAGEFAQIAAAELKGKLATADAPLEEVDIASAAAPRKSTHQASETDITARPAKGARDCSAGSAVDSRASSADSSAVVTPGDATPLRAACEEKDIGECMWEKQAADAEYLISRLSLHV